MKQGDILTHQDGDTKKILAICGEVVYLQYLDKKGNRVREWDNWYLIEDIKSQGWVIPKEQWKPYKRETYWYIDTGLLSPDNSHWEDDSIDNKRYNIGNCFKTEAEAQLAADKIKDLLKGL